MCTSFMMSTDKCSCMEPEAVACSAVPQMLNLISVAVQVRPVFSGTATLKDATSEAIRDWVGVGAGAGVCVGV